jgi:transposase InsO family protein
MLVPARPNERWSLDFVSDAFTDGRRFRVPAIVDDFSRECLALAADTSLSGLRVARELSAIMTRRGRPKTIVSDNASSSPSSRGTGTPSLSRPMRFDMICEASKIEHRLTKPNHPWSSERPGRRSRMNRTIKDATVKRYHYDSHEQLRSHLADFMAAYNFARRLKTLGGLTPYEYICKVWTSEPDRFILDPIHQMPGLNT